MLSMFRKPAHFEDAKTIVAKSPDVVAAEKELADIQIKQQTLTSDIGRFNSKLDSEDTMAVHAAALEITKLERDQSRWSRRSAELRSAIEQQKPAYAKAVRFAIGQQRRDAAVRIAKAISDYQSAIVDLKATDRLLNSVQANQQKFSEIPFASRIAASIQPVIAECDEDLKR